MSNIKAVIFDMDGELIDAKEWHYEALNAALKHFGFEISRHDHLVTYDGLPTRDKLEMLTRERDLPRELHVFINQLKQRYTVEFVNERLVPNFLHEFALSQLKIMDYRMAVASNSIRKTIDLMMDKAALSHYLEFTLSNEDVVKGKPDPEIYLKAIERLELEPNQCIIVEDNPHGLEAAYGSGAHVLQVADVSQTNLDNILNFINRVS
jgi:HAD superfamily hydrolase (TIGR01509 family)